MTEVTFEIPGLPIPQPRYKFARIGNHTSTYIPKNHPIHGYRAAIVEAAKCNAFNTLAAEKNIHIFIRCFFKRPKSHLKKNGDTRKGAPKLPPRSDVDNLAKGILDALQDSQALFKNDDQVELLTIQKGYSEKDHPGRTIVTVVAK